MENYKTQRRINNTSKNAEKFPESDKFISIFFCMCPHRIFSAPGSNVLKSRKSPVYIFLPLRKGDCSNYWNKGNTMFFFGPNKFAAFATNRIFMSVIREIDSSYFSFVFLLLCLETDRANNRANI